MTTNLKYFLIVAEELNISHAAKRLMISQQSLSQHIKKLEEEYNVELFTRKPRLALTPAGVAFQGIVSKIQVLENSLSYELNTMRYDFRGTLTVGITNSRAAILMPEILPKFRSVFPNIKILLQYNSSENLVNKLTRGFIDAYIGLGTVPGEQITVDTLAAESAYLIVSEALLREHQVSREDILAHTTEDGTDISVFKQIPFIGNQEDERIYGLYEDYFSRRGIRFEQIVQCNDSSLRIRMCTHNIGMTTVLEPFLIHAIRHNKTQTGNNHLHIFRLPGFSVNSIIAYYTSSFMPQYLSTFVTLVKKYVGSMTLKSYTNRSSLL